MGTQSTLTNAVNAGANSVPSDPTQAVHRSGEHRNPVLAGIRSSFNTQLLTHYGYYLSPRPTIQQLKK